MLPKLSSGYLTPESTSNDRGACPDELPDFHDRQAAQVEWRALAPLLSHSSVMRVSRDGGERPDLIVVGHSLEIQTVGLRAVDTQKIRFERLVTCRVGEAMAVTERGGRRRELGVVEQLFPLDA